jgi:hypothetical protein
MKGIGTILAAILLLLGLIGIGSIGCSSESRKTALHKPGVYKGLKDPLLYHEQQQNLINRFKLVQTDR